MRYASHSQRRKCGQILMIVPKTVIGKKNISEHVTKLPHTYISEWRSLLTRLFSANGKVGKMLWVIQHQPISVVTAPGAVIVPTDAGGSLPITLSQNENFCLPQAVVNPEELVKRLLIGWGVKPCLSSLHPFIVPFALKAPKVKENLAN